MPELQQNKFKINPNEKIENINFKLNDQVQTANQGDSKNSVLKIIQEIKSPSVSDDPKLNNLQNQPTKISYFKLMAKFFYPY